MAPSGLRVTWSFASVINAGVNGYVFPSYIAHLIANVGRVSHPLVRPFACATIVNSGTTTQTASLTVRFGSYLMMDATSSVSVNAGQTVTSCPPVAFNFDALRRVAVSTPGVIAASVRDGGGADLGSANQAVAVLPISTVLTGRSALDLLAVTSEPPQVRSILTSVSAASQFPGGFGDSGYRRGQFYRYPAAIPAASWFYDVLLLDAGESIEFTLSTVSGGLINEYVFSQPQYAQWSTGVAGAAASAVWIGQGSNARQTFVAPSAGVYYFVLHNVATDRSARTVSSWTRQNTRYDVASDALRAIYTVLQGYGFTYSNIPADYFGAVGQHVRLPAESLMGSAGANCIDGTILFASLLELAGMEPVMITVRRPGGGGHAYIGVKARPSNYSPAVPAMFAAPATIWAVETTMMGTSTFQAASSQAFTERTTDMSNFAAMMSGADYYEVDVVTQRVRGITPIP